jgi:hypothetical protein
MNLPWTRAELEELRDRLGRSIQDIECDNPEIRPLPPMEEAEAKDLLMRLVDTAMERKLDHGECNLIGQLLCCYRMAVEARMLKTPGRYFVFSEADLLRLATKLGNE